MVLLNRLGAHVTGFSLEPDTDPALFELIGGDALCNSIIGDIRDANAIRSAVQSCDPEIVIHMAAQPIVRRSITDPIETFETNVMGTCNLLHALIGVAADVILVVTSDKVYHNDESGNALKEGDRLGGFDPYSASKAATELVTDSFRKTYFEKAGVAVATARCGNIVGGGDYSVDRIVPDIVRSAESGSQLVLRHPEATRPWLHVIDGINGYCSYIEFLAKKKNAPNCMNFGPSEQKPLTVGALATDMLSCLSHDPDWVHEPVPNSIEKRALAVDSTQARTVLNWTDLVRDSRRIELIAEWHQKVKLGSAPLEVCESQLSQVLSM